MKLIILATFVACAFGKMNFSDSTSDDLTLHIIRKTSSNKRRSSPDGITPFANFGDPHWQIPIDPRGQNRRRCGSRPQLTSVCGLVAAQVFDFVYACVRWHNSRRKYYSHRCSLP